MLLAALYVLVCLPGFAIVKIQNKEWQMYSKGTYAFIADRRFRELFPTEARLSGTFLYFAAKGDHNLLEPQTLLELGRAVDAVHRVKTAAGQGLGETCLRLPNGDCEVQSIFHYFSAVMGGNMSTAPAGMGEVEGLAYLLGSYCSQQEAACGSLVLAQDGFLVGSTPGRSTGGLPHISMVMVAALLDPGPVDPGGGETWQALQQAILEHVHAPDYRVGADSLQTDHFNAFVFNTAALEHEAQRPGNNEAHLMGIAFGLILVFVCAAIYAPSAPHSRIMLAMCCMVVVVLSMACCFAINGYIGNPITSMTTLVVFVLFGVSVDDIIVVVHTCDRLPGVATPENVDDRVVESLCESGPAITLTSLTSLAAFLVAASTSIPNISYFCVTAAFGVFSVYVLQLLLFLPLFVLDERRRTRLRRDCCLSACLGAASAGEQKELPRALRVAVSPSVPGGCGLVDALAHFVAEHRAVQVAVTLAFVVVTGVSVWGSTKANSYSDLTEYYIDDSFMKEMFRVRDLYLNSLSPNYLIIEHQGEGLFGSERLAALNGLYDDLAAQDYTHAPYRHWLRDFEAYLNASAPNQTALEAERGRLAGDARAFGARVSEFLAAPPFAAAGGTVVPSLHLRDIVFEGGTVAVSRLVMQFESGFTDLPRLFASFEHIVGLAFPRGDAHTFESPRVPHAWVFSWIYQMCERDKDMLRIIFVNLALACVAVAIAVGLLLSPLVGLFVFFLVFALDAIILALLTLYGQNLDFVAFLVLSMTIGLTVDYSTHTAHAYIHHKGTPDEKLRHSIGHMGQSVLSGGGSTVLGLFVLAFAKSESFRAFFKILSTAICVGTFVGVAVSPVLLRSFHGLGMYLAQVCGRRTSAEISV